MNAPRRTAKKRRAAGRLLALCCLSAVVGLALGAGRTEAQQNDAWQATTRGATSNTSASRAPSTRKPARETSKRKAGSKAQDKSAASSSSLDSAGAQERVEAGVNALNAGRQAAAISSISSAIESGKLPASQTARALYYRGLAYRQDKKPAQAIADLTKSLWLKNGLDAKLRKDALAQRAAAYREAGLPDQAQAQVARAPNGAAAATVGARKEAAAKGETVTRVTPGSSGGLGGLFGSLFGGEATSSTGSINSGTAASPPVRRSAAVQPALPAVKSQAVASRPWSSNVSKAKETRRAPSTTVAKADVRSPENSQRVVPAPATAKGVRTAPARVTQTAPSPRSTGRQPTSNVVQKAAAPVRTAAVAAPAGLPALSPAASGGRFGVQVAAVRTQDQAQQVAAGLQRRYGSDLGGRAPIVEPAAVGTMGTLYRVRIGPFATANESRALCEAFKRDGMSCLVYTQ